MFSVPLFPVTSHTRLRAFLGKSITNTLIVLAGLWLKDLFTHHQQSKLGQWPPESFWLTTLALFGTSMIILGVAYFLIGYGSGMLARNPETVRLWGWVRERRLHHEAKMEEEAVAKLYNVIRASEPDVSMSLRERK